MKGLTFPFGVFVVAAVFSSCDPKPDPDALVKDMVVKTSFDNTVKFGSYASYAMPIDTIGLVDDNDPTDTLIVGPYGQSISREVKKYMDKAGYTQVPPKQSSDLGVLVFVVQNVSVTQSVVFSSIGYSYGSYGYGYSNAPYVNTYVSNSATLIIQIVDLKNITAQNQVNVIWTAFIGDVISSPDPLQKSIDGVDQAFTQSPYIKK